MTGYETSHAEGFIRLYGLPLAVAAHAGKASPGPKNAEGIEPVLVEAPGATDAG